MNSLHCFLTFFCVGVCHAALYTMFYPNITSILTSALSITGSGNQLKPTPSPTLGTKYLNSSTSTGSTSGSLNGSTTFQNSTAVTTSLFNGSLASSLNSSTAFQTSAAPFLNKTTIASNVSVAFNATLGAADPAALDAHSNIANAIVSTSATQTGSYVFAHYMVRGLF